MSGGTKCTLNAAERAALQDTLKLESGATLVLKCSLATKEISIDEYFERQLSPLEVVEEAELAGISRLVVYVAGWKVPSDPHGLVVPGVLLIYFNVTESSNSDLSQTYLASATSLLQE